MEAFRRLVFAATLAGLGAGLALTFLHHTLSVPLIVMAERYESPSPQHDGERAWHPHSARERALATAISDILTGIAFGLLLMAVWQWRDMRPDWRQGVAWGLGGFLATTVAPSLGLPAELPGSAAAALPARQLWWVATAIITAVGLGIACFAENTWLRIGALATLGLPHLIGAPQPLAAEGTVPAQLLRAFQVAVYVCNFHFWVVLGLLASLVHRPPSK